MEKETVRELGEKMLTGVNGGTVPETCYAAMFQNTVPQANAVSSASWAVSPGSYTAMFQNAEPQSNAVPVAASAFCTGSYQNSGAMQSSGALSGEPEGSSVSGMFADDVLKTGI